MDRGRIQQHKQNATIALAPLPSPGGGGVFENPQGAELAKGY